YIVSSKYRLRNSGTTNISILREFKQLYDYMDVSHQLEP
ncbi:unnamed protein product, partial [Allacma fusca]